MWDGSGNDNLFIANITGTLSGSIPKAYTVAIGDGGAGFANITIPSAMTIKGTLDVGFEGSLLHGGHHQHGHLRLCRFVVQQ